MTMANKANVAKYTFSSIDATKFYQFLGHGPGEYTEIRAIEWKREGGGKSIPRFVNNLDDFLKWCKFYTEEEPYRGKYHVYAGVNPRKRKGGKAEDISRVTGLPFDIDSARAEGYEKDAATDEEINKAYAGPLGKLLDYIRKNSGIEPYIDSSGNGFRVIQAIDIPLTAENRDTVQAQLHAYHDKITYECNSENGVFDRITDLPRIVKVPGTWSVKGSDTETRPHRQAKHRNGPQKRVPDTKVQEAILSIPVDAKQDQEDQWKAPDITFTMKLSRLRPCFRRFVQHGDRASTREDRKDETAVRFALVEEAYANGFTESETVELFRKADDFDRDTTEKEVSKKWLEIKRKSSRPYKCTSLRNHGACMGPDCQLYDKNILKKSQNKQPKEEEKEAIQLDHITQIENPEHLKQKITVPAVVSSTFRSYAIPSEVKATYYDADGMRHSLSKIIDIDDPINLKFPNATSNFKYKTLLGLFPEIPPKTQVQITDTAYRTTYTGRIRPPVFTLEKQGDQIVDEQGFEYKDYSISIASNTQQVFPASSLMTLTGYVLPDPNTQRTTILATGVEFPEAIQNYDKSKLLELYQFYRDKTIDERLEWIYSNFEQYSKIIGRRNVTTATFLGFYTPTWIELDGERQRGWANILILGDSTTGKTETVRKAIRLLQAGTIITAETASSVGLVGAATQYDRSGWAVDWGLLVLNNGKLLAVDGAQKLDKYQWAALAESERSGVVTIAKAAKDTAYAQTRQIKIANPTDPDSRRSETKTLAEYFYPVQGAGSFLDIQNVARLDLAVFVDANDVDASKINKRFNEEPDPRLNLLGEVLKWVWSNTTKIKFTSEALDHLLEESTRLYDKFNDKKIPLVSIDLKWKIARLSAAVAAITLSTDEAFNTLTIEKNHVEHITRFIESEYTAAGLDQLVKHSGDIQINTDTAEDILYDLGEAIGTRDEPDTATAYKVLEFIAYQGSCVKDQIKDKFNLSDKNQLRPLLARLNSNDLIKQGRGYSATAKLNRLVRYIEATPDDFATFTTFATVKKDTPPNTIQGQGRLG